MMMTYSDGVEPQISSTRWKTRSVSPPKYPYTAPAITPRTVVANVTISAKVTDSRTP